MTARSIGLIVLIAVVIGTAVAADETRVGYAASSGGSVARCDPRWTVMKSPTVLNGVLSAVAPRTPDDVWAVGAIPSSFVARKAHRPLIERWDGTRWARVPSPPFRGSLLDVAAVSADDAWAVGRTDGGASLIEHWTGLSWNRSTIASRATLDGVSATSAADAWAVGSNDVGAIVLHWDGSRWTRVASRPRAELADVIALSPTDVWTAGNQGEEKLLTMHWDGVHWHNYVRPAPPREDLPVGLDSIAALSSTDIWAAGGGHEQGASGFDSLPVVLRWDGQRWANVTRQASQGSAGIAAIAVRAPDEPWITGTDLGAYALANGGGSFLGRWHAGVWAISSLPAGRLLHDLASDPVGALWAVGLTGRGSGINGFPVLTTPLIERSGC